MTDDQHYRCLESMYQAAPINKLYPPVMDVSDGKAVIEIEISSDYFHSAGAVHGSVYFKVLDDSAFFAANSREPDVFVLTSSFTTYITRPVSSGTLRAVGKVVNQNRSQWIVESVLFDSEDREIARGNGIFVRSKVLLKDAAGYLDGIK